MGRINWINDVGAPLAVAAIDLGVEQVKPDWNEYASYAVAGLGYVGAYMGYGGDFVKNMGIAALPWAAKNIYNRVKTMGGATRRVAIPTRVAGRISTNKPQFAGARLT